MMYLESKIDTKEANVYQSSFQPIDCDYETYYDIKNNISYIKILREPKSDITNFLKTDEKLISKEFLKLKFLKYIQRQNFKPSVLRIPFPSGEG